MSLVFMDGFDKYTDTAGLDTVYSRGDPSRSAYYPTGGRFGGGALWINDYDPNDCKVLLPANFVEGDTFHVAFHRFTADGSSPTPNQTTDGRLFTLSTAGTDYLTISRNATDVYAYLLGTTQNAPWTYTYDTWHHIETAIKLSQAGDGFCKIWLDGALIMNYSGATLNAGGLTFSQFHIQGLYNTPNNEYIDDLVIWSSGAGGLAASQLAEHRIETLSPTGDGDTTTFTPLSGNNVDNVDEAGTNDGDTSYNTGDTPGEKDLFTLPSLSYTPSSIHGVQVVTWAKTVAGGDDLATLLKISGSEYGAAAKNLTTGYTRQADYFALNPHTAGYWTPSALSGLQAGYFFADEITYPPIGA